jgi:D-alanyl-D-alanine carboxypeptidase
LAKREHRNRIAAVAVAAIALMTAPLLAQEDGPANAKGKSVDKTGKGYTAAFVIDPATRKVYFEENADMVLPTASMAKMMTCLIAMERISHGLLKLDKPVTISARASKMGGSQIYAKAGQTLPMQTLLAAAMIQSANDAATAMAEDIAGSDESFAEMMNARAKQLGLTSATFYDPHGAAEREEPGAGRQDERTRPGHAGIELMKYPLMRQYAKTATFPFENGLRHRRATDERGVREVETPWRDAGILRLD